MEEIFEGKYEEKILKGFRVCIAGHTVFQLLWMYKIIQKVSK
jgi:hypothetical protein